MDTRAQMLQVYEESSFEQFRKDPFGYFEEAGLTEADLVEAYTAAGLPYVSAKTYWWGLEIILNHDACVDIENGDIGPVTKALEALGAVGKVLGALLGAAFKLCAARVKAVDRGNGVYLPIPWPVLPTLVGVGTAVAYILAALKPND